MPELVFDVGLEVPVVIWQARVIHMSQKARLAPASMIHHGHGTFNEARKASGVLVGSFTFFVENAMFRQFEGFATNAIG